VSSPVTNTHRQSAPRRAVHIPCDCCATVWAFKRTHGLTPSQAYKREHWPILAAAEEGRLEDYHQLVRERAQLEKVRRDALAYCVECRNPLLATEHGFQFCPYERAAQHQKLKEGLAALARVAVGSPLRFDPRRAQRAAGDAPLARPSKTKRETPPLLRIQSS